MWLRIVVRFLLALCSRSSSSSDNAGCTPDSKTPSAANGDYKLNEPPMMPFGLPILGHALDLVRDPIALFLRVRQQYAGTFNLRIGNETLTFIGPELYHEFVRAPDRLLSLPRAFGHFLMLDQQFGYDAWKDQIQVPVIRLEANHNLDTFNERLERWMTFELDRQVGPLAKGETKVVRKVEHLVELVFGRASAACLVGDELAANDELLDSFIDMGVCVSRGTKIARVLPEFITKPLIRRLSGFQRHIEVFERIVVPEIEKRRREAREAFEQGVEFVRPHDIMQSLLEVPDDEGNERPADQISRTLMSMVFAAIHTTANTGANLIFDTAGRANIMQAIIEEQHKLGTVSTASVDVSGTGQITADAAAGAATTAIAATGMDSLQHLAASDSAIDLSGSRPGSPPNATTATASPVSKSPSQNSSAASTYDAACGISPPLNRDTFTKMPLLDACIRETMRTNSFQVVPMRRAMQDLTFSNGMQVPEGRICISVTTDAHVNPDIHPQPFKYDPYRFVNVPRKSATTVSRDFRHFGGGRNACPGRFFAVHEMKMMMVLILRKYAIRTVSGTRRPSRVTLTESQPPLDDAVVFEGL